MIRSLLLALAFFTSAVSANPEVSFVFGGVSYHMTERAYKEEGIVKPYNETNATFGVQVEDIRWVLFDNSYNRTSTAFLWVPSKPVTDNLKLGMRLGFATGYQETPVDTPILPVVGLELDYRIGNFHIVPAVQLPGVATLHIQWDV